MWLQGPQGPGELRGGPGTSPEDYRPGRLHEGTGDDYLEAVSYPSVGVVCCDRHEDAAVAGHDAVGGHREQVRHVDLGLVAEIGDPPWEFLPEVGVREYGPKPYAGIVPR